MNEATTGCARRVLNVTTAGELVGGRLLGGGGDGVSSGFGGGLLWSDGDREVMVKSHVQFDMSC